MWELLHGRAGLCLDFERRDRAAGKVFENPSEAVNRKILSPDRTALQPQGGPHAAGVVRLCFSKGSENARGERNWRREKDLLDLSGEAVAVPDLAILGWKFGE